MNVPFEHHELLWPSMGLRAMSASGIAGTTLCEPRGRYFAKNFAGLVSPEPVCNQVIKGASRFYCDLRSPQGFQATQKPLASVLPSPVQIHPLNNAL